MEKRKEGMREWKGERDEIEGKEGKRRKRKEIWPTEDEHKKSPVLDTISEGTREGDINKDNGTVKAENSDDLNLEEVESVPQEKVLETSPEKAEPKSPVKAWGGEKATTPTDGRF